MTTSDAQELMWVSFAVNDDNGETRGGIRRADFGCDWLTLDNVEGNPTAFRCLFNPNRVRIGRREFQWLKYQGWHGNMAFEGIKVTRETAQQIAEYLRSTGKYQPDMGAVTVWDAWETNQPIIFEAETE